ncbi:MAG: DegQ family serine endoprotease [Alphaproteobacteria bacterium]|nr:DegQ family serine endoprotease [Alphaproteobacteria bacterium]
MANSQRPPKRARTRPQAAFLPLFLWALFAALVLPAATTIPAALAVGWDDPDAPKSEIPSRVVPHSGEQIRLSFAPLVKAATPAVVNIYTSKVVAQQQLSPLFSDPFFRRFFGKDFPFPGPRRERIQNSLGSGVVVSGDGLVVTSHHIIKDSDQIKVVLADNREFRAEVISRDTRTDLAVLRIDDGDQAFASLPLGDSDELEVGDLVLAIGNPFGVGQTVTSGIVSALARTTGGISDYQFFIQTDAAINPGNSGGALVDMKGRLVGINTAIFSKSGGSHGIGFAIPVNMVKAVIRGAKSGGPIVRPWLGAAGQEVTSDIATSLGLSRPTGVLVNAVRENSPAQRAGILVSDVIISLDGKDVDNLDSLRFRLATLSVEGSAVFGIIRRGKTLELTLPLEAPPEEPPRNVTTLAGAHPLNGAEVGNLSPAFNTELGLDELAEGVFVLSLQRGSPAHRFNSQPGDIILRVTDVKVESVAHLRELLNAPTSYWKISVQREGKVLTQEFRQ